jgi:hypothetical protein
MSLEQLIDPYWTFLPVLMAYFFALHPRSVSDPIRSRVVLALTWIWSIRLTHSYFRREKWQWGAREDWRFADMRRKFPKHWWWISFFYVYVSQQVPSPPCLPISSLRLDQFLCKLWSFEIVCGIQMHDLLLAAELTVFLCYNVQ